MTLQQWIHVIIHLSKLVFTSPRVNPNVNYELWVAMCQYMFTNSNKRATLVRDFDGGSYVYKEEGQKVYEKSSFCSVLLST